MRIRIAFVAWLLLSCAPAKVATVPTPQVAADWACVPPDASEEGRLACAIVEQLFVQARLAKAEPARVVLKMTDDGFSANVERGATSETFALPLRSHVFAGPTWAPLVPTLLGAPEPEMMATTSSVLVALNKDTSARTIAEQASIVSGELQASTRKVYPHLKAGLLLSVLAWREGGRLADPREFLTLATAHLAIAAGLHKRPEWENGPTSNDELVAWLLVDTLVSADEARRGRFAFAPTWKSAFGVTVEGDWKKFRGSPSPKGIEQLVRFQVLAARAGSDVMDSELDAWGRPDDPVFDRAVFSAELDRPVPAMRRHAEGLADREAAERGQVTPLLARGANVVPEAAWQRHFSRNAMSAALVESHLYRITLDLPDQANTSFLRAKKALSGDPLWPLGNVLFAGRMPEMPDCSAGSIPPSDVPFRLRALRATLCRSPPPALDVPRGTVFDGDFRFSIEPQQKASPAQRDGWLALAPSSFGPRLLEWRGTPRERLTVERGLEVMGPLMAYDRRAVKAVGTQVSQPTREVLEALCEVEPSECGQLVAFLEMNHLPGVIDVLERWRGNAGSQVAFSNNAGALLDQYFQDKRLADAEALAKQVGATGSHSGLRLEAEYHERVGHYARTEEILKSVAERYRDSFPLDEFYLRAAKRKYLGTHFASLARDAEARIFGGPLVKVSTAQLQPNDPSVPLHNLVSPDLYAFGLRRGDVAFAVDGLRVRTPQQFVAMLHRSEAPMLRVMVARGGAVVELKGKFRRQRYGR